MKQQLKVFYIVLNGLVLSLIIILWQLQGRLGYPYAVDNKWIQTGLAVASALFAMVLPVWLRIMAFSAHHRKGQRATYKDFLRFERWTIIVSSIAFALAPVAYVLEINLWVRYLVTFMGIYALYFSYPSDKKLNTDLKLFKLSQDEEAI